MCFLRLSYTVIELYTTIVIISISIINKICTVFLCIMTTNVVYKSPRRFNCGGAGKVDNAFLMLFGEVL